MDETRKLLDSLMGNTRDMNLNEAKKNKGKNFMKEDVCKHYLLGFCPLNELAASKMLGKRNVSDCRKMHSDALRDEFEAHSDRSKYQEQYEKSLLPVLEGLVREADAWVARERANVQRTELSTPEKQTVNNMPPTVKEEYEGLTKDMNKLMAAAEEIAEKGDVDGSKFKVMLAGEIKEKIKELEEKHIVTYTVTHKGEEVCEICGARTEANDGKNHARYNAHFKGKVHVSYVKIREWVEKLRAKHGGAFDINVSSGRSRRSDRPGDSGRERERRDDRRDDREKDRRGGDERRRSRSRGRGGDRGGDRVADRRDDRRDYSPRRRDDRRDDRDRDRRR